jgi:hypothetical protein
MSPEEWADHNPDFVKYHEEERKRHEAISYRMSQIMMQEYWKHINEEKESWWNWFNNEREQ